MALDDYGALIQSGQNLVPDYLKQGLERAQTAALGAETQNYQVEAQAKQQQQQRMQLFQQVLAKSDGSPGSIARMMMQFPEVADHLKQASDLQDKAKTDADLTTTAEIYSAATSGKWDLAKKLAHTRADADKAAGITDPPYASALESLDKAAEGDPKEQKAVLNLLGLHLAGTAGPEHFATVYGALKGGYTLDAGAARFDDTGNMVAHSPFVKGEDGALYDYNSVMGGAAGKGGDTSAGGSVGPAAASVASALSASGLPAPVVAGFMGNFSAEGGYTGAQGDGGSASGIGQWRGDRAANFEKVTGKPVTEATPADQAQFVAWEMKNPEAAGMTVSQRDQILAAKTPAQAAALIDKFYERSDGSARQKRMAAATAFAGDAGPQAASGPRVLLPGRDDPGQYRTLTPAEVKSRGLDASQQYQLNTKTGALTGLGKIDAADQPLPGDESKSGPAYLATIPPNMATQVKALAEGRLPMPSSFALAKPYWQKMLQMTAQYDPTFDAASAPARKAAITAFTGNGKAAQIIGSVNRVANHLDLLNNESKRLAGPETGWSVTNSLLAGAGQAFEPADAKAYDTEVGFVAGELGKIAKAGVVTEGEIDRIISNLGRKNSAGTRDAAIKAAVGIISGAVDPLKDQYNSAFTNNSTRPNIPWVSPKAQQIYKKIGGVDVSLTDSSADTNASGSGATSAPVRVSSPQEAARLPSGTLFVTPDGRTLRKK